MLKRINVPAKNSLTIPLASRFFIFFIAWISEVTMGIPTSKGDLPLPFFHLFVRWDSGYYLNIAKTGYHGSNWAFFPLYPLTMSALSSPLAELLKALGTPTLFVMGVHRYVLSGFIVSNFSFLLMCILLYKLTVLLYNKKTAFFSVFLMSFFPTSFFFSAVYTEALFLLFTVLTFYFLEKKWWKTSVFFCFFSGLTRVVGLFLTLPLLYRGIVEYFQGKKKLKELLYLTLAFLPLPLFMLYAYSQCGDPFITFNVERKYWHVGIHDPLKAIMHTSYPDKLYLFPILFLTLFSLLYFVFRERKTMMPYIIYSVPLTMLYLFYAEIISFPRFSLTIIPVFWALGQIMEKKIILQFLILSLSCMLLSIYTSLFVTWKHIV